MTKTKDTLNQKPRVSPCVELEAITVYRWQCPECDCIQDIGADSPVYDKDAIVKCEECNEEFKIGVIL